MATLRDLTAKLNIEIDETKVKRLQEKININLVNEKEESFLGQILAVLGKIAATVGSIAVVAAKMNTAFNLLATGILVLIGMKFKQLFVNLFRWMTQFKLFRKIIATVITDFDKLFKKFKGVTNFKGFIRLIKQLRNVHKRSGMFRKSINVLRS